MGGRPSAMTLSRREAAAPIRNASARISSTGPVRQRAESRTSRCSGSRTCPCSIYQPVRWGELFRSPPARLHQTQHVLRFGPNIMKLPPVNSLWLPESIVASGQHLTVPEHVIQGRPKIVAEVGKRRGGSLGIHPFSGPACEASRASIFLVRLTKSTGFVSYSSQPASMDFSRSV